MGGSRLSKPPALPEVTDFSRFDTGGIQTSPDTNKLTAYLFSERGLYRPGDEFNIGMIVRSQDWLTPLQGVPLEVVVTDARGLQIHKERLQLSREGFAEFKYRTEETSPTGGYEINLSLVENEKNRTLLGSTRIRVEEFLPDTMKIATHLSTEKSEGWVSPDDLKGLVSLRNLFGTPAESHRVASSITLSPFFPTFRKLKEYQFFDPYKAKKSFQERLEDTKTNEKGEAEFALDLKRFENGTYRLSFLAEGYAAEGGRSVTAESSVLVSPLKYLIGYKPEGNLGYIKKNGVAAVDIIGVDPSLKQTKVSDLSLQLIETRTLSVLVKQPDGTFRYDSVKKEIPIRKKALNLSDKGQRLVLPTDQAGDFSYLVKGQDDRDLLRVDFNVVGLTNVKQKLEKNSELQIKLSKADYASQEEIELQITAPFAGAGLITLEREKVYAHKWFKSSSTNSVQRIRIPAGLEGGGYVNVAFVRSLDSQEIFTSPLSYGVVPFSISRESRANPITLEVQELMKPGEVLAIHYRTRKPAKIAIFAVDEGILQVAGYKTPDPLAYFFKKRALEVTTAQLLDLILPEFSVVKAVSASGGDADGRGLGKNLNPFKRKRDKPVVYWSGIIDADSEDRELTYPIPDYFNGSLRIMAVAVSVDSIGVTDRKTTVRGDFVISPNVPTFTTPGDEFDVGVSLSNNLEKSGPAAAIQLSLKTSEHLQVQGEKAITLKVPEGHELSTHFKVKALDQLGSGNLTFVATLGTTRSQYSVDLSVRPAVPYVTQLVTGSLKGGNVEIPLTRKMDPHFREESITVSALPLALSHGLLKYLDSYPYGCTEQLVSKAFPILVLKAKPGLGLVPEKVESNLKEMSRILRTRQNAVGAFGMWSAESTVSSFYSAYAYHYLTEAKEKGFPVYQEMVTRVEGYLKSLLRQDPASLAEARVWAYSLYLLGRNGILQTNELVSLRKVLDAKFPKEWMQDLTGIYLAATYEVYKQHDEAVKLLAKSKMGDAQVPDYDNFYDSLVRDSQYLYLVSKHFPELLKQVTDEQLQALIRPIAEGRYNTVSSSYAILALDAYSSQASAPERAVTFSVSQLLAPAPWENLPLPTGLFPKTTFSNAAKKLKVENQSELNLYYQVSQAGFDTTLPDKELKQKLEVYREIQDDKGAAVSKASMGSEYGVHIQARSLGGAAIANVAIVDLIPSGFEVILDKSAPAQKTEGEEAPHGDEVPAAAPVEEHENSEEGGEAWNFHFWQMPFAYADEVVQRGPAGRLAGSSTDWTPDYVDIREDRVILFGSIGASTVEFRYKLKAINQGTFTVPPIFAESMYDRSIQARGLGGKVTVEGK